MGKTLLLFLLGGVAWAQTPMIGSCAVFPADNIWNTAVDQLPVSSNSATYVSTIGTGKTLHPDF